MKLYFDFGLLTFIHFAMWCDEHQDEVEGLISFEAAEKLQAIADMYLKETEAKEEMANSKVLNKDQKEHTNDELRKEVKLKKL